MKVEKLMCREVFTCTPVDGLDAPARAMRDHACGCVPVIDDEQRVVGMITDRDITMAALRFEKPLEKIPVKEAMTTDVFTCTSKTTISEAQRIMRMQRVRRLPVIEDERLAGIVSIDDIAREAGLERTLFAPEVSANEVGMTMAAVTRPKIVVDVERSASGEGSDT